MTQESNTPGCDGYVSISPWENLDRIKRIVLITRLAYFEGDKVKVAKMFGVSLKTVYNWIKRYKL